MDIYSFIEHGQLGRTPISKRLANQCRRMNLQFAPLDMAVIIYYSEEERHKKYAAYNWLIENTADCEVPESDNYFRYLYHWDYHSSLHELLRRIIYV